jgi:2-polyprenyl-3-methyl-5-hydroxy-6-metoxy-1,4-benzoquinol methylase
MTENIFNNEITDKPYWEEYYKKQTADINLIRQNGKVYDKYWSICIDTKTKSVIEIGAFPGRYLSYVADKYNLKPTGLDFQSDLSVIKKNFQVFNIDDYELINEDFLEWKPNKKYDLVLSIGFVEHFKNYEEVITKHFHLMGKNSKIFFHVPNKRYLRKLYGQIADRENLKVHNLEVMSFDVFKRIAEKHNMEIEVLEYFGPFQYGLHGEKPNFLRQFFFQSFRFLFKKLKLNSLVEKHPSKLWSSCIICIMKKK